MPRPTQTNWGIRSDLAYGIKHRSHARRLTDEQAGNQDDEPSINKSAEEPKQTGPSDTLYQRTGRNNLKRYRQIHSKINSQSALTLTLNNVVVLRKPVAIKKKPKSSLPYQP